MREPTREELKAVYSFLNRLSFSTVFFKEKEVMCKTRKLLNQCGIKSEESLYNNVIQMDELDIIEFIDSYCGDFGSISVSQENRSMRKVGIKGFCSIKV